MPSTKTTKLKSHGSTSGTKKRAIKNDKPFMFSEKQQKVFAEKCKASFDLDQIGVENDVEKLNELNASINKNTHELLAKWPAKEYLKRKLDETGVDNDPGIDVPLHARGGEWKWNFEEKPMSLTDKVTWVLTAVNVAILISLVIKNI